MSAGRRQSRGEGGWASLSFHLGANPGDWWTAEVSTVRAQLLFLLIMGPAKPLHAEGWDLESHWRNTETWKESSPAWLMIQATGLPSATYWILVSSKGPSGEGLVISMARLGMVEPFRGGASWEV
jgi:hypothetical protein